MKRSKKRTIRICRYCLQDMEYCNGNQRKYLVYVNPKDEKESSCNFCKASGFDSLFIVY